MCHLRLDPGRSVAGIVSTATSASPPCALAVGSGSASRRIVRSLAGRTIPAPLHRPPMAPHSNCTTTSYDEATTSPASSAQSTRPRLDSAAGVTSMSMRASADGRPINGPGRPDDGLRARSSAMRLSDMTELCARLDRFGFLGREAVALHRKRRRRYYATIRKSALVMASPVLTWAKRMADPAPLPSAS